MDAQLTIRISGKLVEKLKMISKKLGLKKSDIARMAIQEYLKQEEQISEAGPYKNVENLIGGVNSGIPDLGEKHRDYMIERLKKHA